MKLDTNTGELLFENLCISPQTTKSHFFRTFKDRYRQCVVNGAHESYNVTDVEDQDFAFIIYFYNEKFTSINIGLGKRYDFQPFEITDEESAVVKTVLSSLGGENKYRWGEVIFSEDPKGGSIGIIVRYY